MGVLLQKLPQKQFPSQIAQYNNFSTTQRFKAIQPVTWSTQFGEWNMIDSYKNVNNFQQVNMWPAHISRNMRPMGISRQKLACLDNCCRNKDGRTFI
jgi:hypothetical protein